jgi:hypothetical protein
VIGKTVDEMLVTRVPARFDSSASAGHKLEAVFEIPRHVHGDRRCSKATCAKKSKEGNKEF